MTNEDGLDVKVGVDISDVIKVLQNAELSTIKTKLEALETAVLVQQENKKAVHDTELFQKYANIVYKEARQKQKMVLGMMQRTWYIVTGILRATGHSVSTASRVVVSAAFGAVDILADVYTSMMALGHIDPVLAAQAVMGLTSLAMSTASIIQYESEQKQLSREMRGAIYALNGLNNMTGGFW